MILITADSLGVGYALGMDLRYIFLAFLLTGCLPRICQYAPVPAPTPIVSKVPMVFPGANGTILRHIALRNPMLPEGDRLRIATRIEEESQLQEIDPKWVAAVISVESSFNPRAVSSSGAKGLGQMLPGTARDMGVTDPFDIDQGVRATAKYLAWLSKCWGSHPQRLEMVMASYSSGIGTMKRQAQLGQTFTEEQQRYISLVQRTLDLLNRV